MVKPNRPQLALLRGKRGPEVLEAWTREFAGGNRALAERYALALARFLGRPSEVEGEFEAFIGTYSPRTRRAYSFAITEFFEWLASEHGRVVPPHEVTSLDAERYVQWLAEKPYSLRDEKLRDGDQEVRLALYETVEQLGAADLTSIGAAMPAWLREQHPGPAGMAWLHRTLGRMVLHDLLVRTPTLEQLRRENPRLGIDEFGVDVPQPDGTTRSVAIESIFSYSIPPPVAVSRKTIADRLTALSSFWDVLTQGENVGGAEAICRYNVFKPIKRQVARGLSAERREAAARANQLTPALIEQLLNAADGSTLADKRNAALLWFLVLTGARVSEVAAIRRGKPPAAEENRWPGWFDPAGEPPGVWMRRKGNKLQWLPYPPYALRALGAFQAALAEHAAPRGTQPFDPGAPRYLHPDSPKWRYRLLTDEPDAPLFPPVNFWGANSTQNYQELKPNLPNTKGGTAYTRPMTRHGVEKLLKRIAKKADLSAEDQAKVHAHAIRHFAATAMVVQGKPLREVQAILGHESITTTERYIAEERRPIALSGQNEILDYIAGARPREDIQPPAPRQPLAAFPPQVIQTYGVERPEPPGRPAPPPRRAQKPPAPKRRPEERVAPLAPPAPPPAPPAPVEAEAEVCVTPMPPTSPVVDEPAVATHQTAEGTVIALADEAPPPEATEVRDGISPGSPFDLYDALEPDVIASLPEKTIEFTSPIDRKKASRPGLATVHVKTEKGRKIEQVQKNAWLAEHYDPWPVWYGIAPGSLLPWFTRENRKNGVIDVQIIDPTTQQPRTVAMPPLPVLSPDQVYPETKGPRLRLFDALEQLSKEYAQTQPTKLFGLRRWYATFAAMTARLEALTAQRYNWVPFDSKAKVGEDLRAHDDDYIAKWFEQNADRWCAALRVFKEHMPAEIEKKTDEEFREFFNRISLRAGAAFQDIPTWFVSDDPVRDIYDRSPEEWDEFVRWLGAITGSRLTDERREQRDSQEAFADEELQAQQDEARVLLETYYEYTAILGRKGGSETDKRNARLYLKGGPGVEGIIQQLERLGVADPQSFGFAKKIRIERRIDLILNKAFTGGAAEVELRDPNVLKSAIFDADAFRIDERSKTIRHTAEYKRRFAQRYGEAQLDAGAAAVSEAEERFGPEGIGSDEYAAFVRMRQRELLLQMGEPVSLDSECLMRRAARGMWESARGGLQEKDVDTVRMLYATMLQYIAMIFPCPDDIEKSLREQLGVSQADETLKFEWLAQINRQIRALAAGEEEPLGLTDEQRQQAALIAVMEGAQQVDEATQQRIVARAVADGTLTIGMTGGRKEPIPPAKADKVRKLLADPKTRQLDDAKIAKRVNVPEEYVAEMREKIGVVTQLAERGIVKRKKKTKEPEQTQAPAAPERREYDPSPVAVKTPGRIAIIEPGEQPTTFFGGISDEDLTPNAPPRVYLSPGCMGRCLTYMANAERILPSPLQVIAALTISY